MEYSDLAVVCGTESSHLCVSDHTTDTPASQRGSVGISGINVKATYLKFSRGQRHWKWKGVDSVQWLTLWLSFLWGSTLLALQNLTGSYFETMYTVLRNFSSAVFESTEEPGSLLCWCHYFQRHGKRDKGGEWRREGGRNRETFSVRDCRVFLGDGEVVLFCPHGNTILTGSWVHTHFLMLRQSAQGQEMLKPEDFLRCELATSYMHFCLTVCFRNCVSLWPFCCLWNFPEVLFWIVHYLDFFFSSFASSFCLYWLWLSSWVESEENCL